MPEGLFNILYLVRSRNADYGHVCIQFRSSQFVQKIKPGTIRQVQIEKHDIYFVRQEQPCLSKALADDQFAGAPQNASEAGNADGFIFYN